MAGRHLLPGSEGRILDDRVIILAQASMGHLAEDIEGIAGVPVLKSPPLAMDALVDRIKE